MNERKKSFSALLRDTVALLKEEKRTTLLLSKPIHTAPKHSSPEFSFVNVPVPLPVPDLSPLPPPSPPPAPKKPSFTPNLSHHFPELAHVDRPPDDANARENSALWKKSKIGASVIIFSFGKKEEELLYLKNLAKAIHTRLKPTKILDGNALEKEKRWETLFLVNSFDLILVPEHGFLQSAELKNLVQEPSFSSKTALLLLTPALMQEKAALWKKICQILQK